MPWSLFAVLFFVDTAIWIATGFLQRNFSLTLTLLPAFYVLLGSGAVLSIARHRSFLVLSRETSVAGFLALALAIWTVVAWAANGILLELPVDARVFTLLIPLTIFGAVACAWWLPFTRASSKRLVRVLWVAGAINALVSIATFVVFNILRSLPTQIFFANDRYPVILFPMAGKLWIRTPGLFEAGGTNGSFLTLTLCLTLGYLLFGPSRRRVFWWAIVSLQALIILATLTRRSILCLGIIAILFAVASLVLQRKSRYVAASLVGAAGLAGLLLSRSSGISDPQSLMQRLGFWTANLYGLYPAHPERLAVGFAVTQSALKFLSGSPFQIVDSLYLSLLLYGGLPCLLLFLAYQCYIFLANMRLIWDDWSMRWLAIANVAMTLALLAAGAFVGFVYNTTEGLPYLVGQALCTRIVIEAASTRIPADQFDSSMETNA